MQLLTLSRNNQSVQVNSPAQILLFNFVHNLIAWTRLTPVYYEGAYAGSEFLTYNAGKVYLAIEFECNYITGTASAGQPIDMQFCDMANAVFFLGNNSDSLWNVTTANTTSFNKNFVTRNIWFSRILGTTAPDYIKFNGYRFNT
jgi:hypothetical protein